MMRWGLFAALAMVAWMLRRVLDPEMSDPAASALVALGCLMIGGALAGDLAQRLQLPRITGFIVIGMLLGPFVLALVSVGDLAELRPFEELALGLIALTAGGELRVASLAREWRLLAGVCAANGLGRLVATAAVLLAIQAFVPLLGTAEAGAMLAGAVLLAVISVAPSPATTIAVVTELRARGRLVDIVLGVTVLTDVLALLLFTVAFGAARGWSGGTGLALADVGHLLLGIALSLAIGAVLGIGLGLYLDRVRRHPELVVLGLVLAAVELARASELEYLLLCMAAGFAVRNLFARAAHPFLAALERSSPPVYVVFFALVGAALDLGVFAAVWVAALVVAVLRGALTWAATSGTAALLGASEPVRRWAWMGFIAQAGFSLGLAGRIAREFPDFGPQLAAVIIGGVVLNQLVGPVLWRRALVRSGEARLATAA